MAAKLMMRRSFWYWDRQGPSGENESEPCSPTSSVGVVVVLGWMLSRRKNLAAYTRLYKSCGWDCLVCHPQVFNLVFPSGATALAVSVLEELAKELVKRPGPVVFAVFSGGHKACLYKIIQILLGKCREVTIEEGNFSEVKRSLSGLIFDSSPVDAVSHLGAKFVSHQVLTLQPGRPIGIISRVAYAVSKGVDVVFSRPLGQERVSLWQALYSTVNIGPILFLCSDNDKLAPVETIQIFASNLCNLGGKVNMLRWKESEHVGHYKHYPEQYSAEIVKLLTDAASTYSKRRSRSLQDQCDEMLSNEKGAELKASFDAISESWTDLPEFITAEISRVARLPHVHVKRGCNKAQSNVHVKRGCNKAQSNGEDFYGVEIQTCAKFSDASCDLSKASYMIGSRSRL